MKALVTLILCTAALGLGQAYGSATSRGLVELALRLGGKEVLERGAREGAERAAAQAIQKLGGEGAEKAVQHGGLGLLQAGAKYGDEVWDLARSTPEAARLLGARPQQALELSRKLGPAALQLEARVPGMAERAATQFGTDSLPRLAQAPPAQVQQLIGYAEHATEPAVRTRLFELWVQRGDSVLTVLSKHKTLILAGGLGLKLLDDVKAVTTVLADKVPAEDVAHAVRQVGSGLSLGIIIAASGLALALVILAVWVWRRGPSATVKQP